MSRLTRPVRALAASIIASIASGCSQQPGAADQAPVDLEPGRYEITRSGSGLIKIDEEKAPNSICVQKGETNAFPHTLAKYAYLIHPACASHQQTREGNAISGDIICPVDRKLADGMSHFAYTGAIASDNVEIDVRMKLEAEIKTDSMSAAEAAQLRIGMKAIERMRVAVRAKRTGSC
ncbi:DUF3617 family protein [Hyphococcus sp.]|uniref:DUF3617 family protein n=1 Tax=Hyphococcus sp. TaxID=2038636 RepID=UPI003CCC2837